MDSPDDIYVSNSDGHTMHAQLELVDFVIPSIKDSHTGTPPIRMYVNHKYVCQLSR